MTTLLLIVWIVLALVLVVLSVVKPQRAVHSRFELERLGETGVLRRERLLGRVMALLRFITMLCVILLSVVGWILWNGWGIVAVLVMLIVSNTLSRLAFVHRPLMKLYGRYENALLDFCEKAPFIGVIIGVDSHVQADQRLESPEQLLHLIEDAGHILSNEQQTLMRRGLVWYDQTVKEVMTPRRDIVSVKHGELLGPLVLNDLHASGHQVFPVIEKSLDHVMGQLDTAELLRIDSDKHSQKASSVMTPLNIRFYEDTQLPDALAQLVTHPGEIAIVVDDDDKTVGLVTLTDVLAALLG